jgi:hypothetical protein
MAFFVRKSKIEKQIVQFYFTLFYSPSEKVIKGNFQIAWYSLLTQKHIKT